MGWPCARSGRALAHNRSHIRTHLLRRAEEPVPTGRGSHTAPGADEPVGQKLGRHAAAASTDWQRSASARVTFFPVTRATTRSVTQMPTTIQHQLQRLAQA
jgi:hypothetical protein